MTGYYDLILGLIPLSLVTVTGVLTLLGVSVTAAVPVATSIPVALIGHALFVNGPVDSSQSPTTTADASSASFEPAD